MQNKEKTIKLDEYHLQDVDEAVLPFYYGYMNEVGDWYIIREGADGSIRYHRRSIMSVGLYSAAWGSRATLSYDYWNMSF